MFARMFIKDTIINNIMCQQLLFLKNCPVPPTRRVVKYWIFAHICQYIYAQGQTAPVRGLSKNPHMQDFFAFSPTSNLFFALRQLECLQNWSQSVILVLSAQPRKNIL